MTMSVQLSVCAIFYVKFIFPQIGLLTRFWSCREAAHPVLAGGMRLTEHAQISPDRSLYTASSTLHMAQSCGTSAWALACMPGLNATDVTLMIWSIAEDTYPELCVSFGTYCTLATWPHFGGSSAVLIKWHVRARSSRRIGSLFVIPSKALQVAALYTIGKFLL